MYSFFSSDVSQLNILYKKQLFSFVLLYGRHGMGKTTLVREFLRDKPALFFSAAETVPERMLYAFHREAVRCLKPLKEPGPFHTWEQAFACVASGSFPHRVILVLDEFQYPAQHCPGFLDAFSEAVREKFPAGRVFLIVTCSSPGYAEKLLQEPAFQTITAKASLTSLPFYSCRSLFSGYAPLDQLLLYAVTGGIPALLSRLDTDLSAKENVLRMFFDYASPALSGPLSGLHRELREISTYNFLLEIMSLGKTRLADIASEASVGTNKCAKYLNTLIAAGLIRKEFPVAGEPQKKVRYVFADHMLRFWYRYVYPNISGILAGDGRKLLGRQVLPSLNEYLLPAFETVCAEYLERLADTGQTPFAYRHTGSWWTGGTKCCPYFRIPLVAMDTSHTVLGICHCGSTPAGIEYLERLLAPAEPFGNRTRYCCIFSTGGFTQELRKAARQTGNVWLADPEDIFA